MVRATRMRVHDCRALLWAAGFALCSTHAAGALHQHDIGAPDAFCSACGLTPVEFADDRPDAGVDPRGWTRARTAPESFAGCRSHPFEAERSRAPPQHS